MARVSPQLLCFSYHKSGTSLFFHVMTKISQRLGLSLANLYGLVERLNPEPDIVLLAHSLLRGPLNRPYRAIRLIRDPRDIWVSGYLYHLRCGEGWCRNIELDPTPPIGWPQVDYSMAHFPEDWKRGYLERLEGRSYQQNLLDRSREDGLDFELDGYTACTLAAMRGWTLNEADAMDVRLEDVMDDFDAAMLRIFAHFGFNAEQSGAALEVARTEDIRRMDAAAIAQRPQIHSRTISKWRQVLSPSQLAHFEQRHGDLIRNLGYAMTGDVVVPKVISTTREAGIRLLVDGVAIEPAGVGTDSYSFVVPSGRGGVTLESRFTTGDGAGGSARLGIRVNEITIRSQAGMAVIAPDDPRLNIGWHDAERVGTTFWRWTDGSAAIPWPRVDGPAVVTVRCTTLPEYPLLPVPGHR
jgi:hypothetical protein